MTRRDYLNPASWPSEASCLAGRPAWTWSPKTIGTATAE